MKREIVKMPCQSEKITIDRDLDTELVTWLLGQASEYRLTTLLAYADDGLVWGKVEDGRLLLSGQYFPDVSTLLRAATLQECRLFGPFAELHLWGDEGSNWQACLVRDDSGSSLEAFDEYQMLWGTKREDENGGFTLVRDGERGHRHAPPVSTDELKFSSDGPRRPLRLHVRHYLAEDNNTGLAYVTLSRLVAVCVDTEVE